LIPHAACFNVVDRGGRTTECTGCLLQLHSSINNAMKLKVHVTASHLVQEIQTGHNDVEIGIFKPVMSSRRKIKQNVYGFFSLKTHLIFIVVERRSLRYANRMKIYELGQTSDVSTYGKKIINMYPTLINSI
jgi:hypothetical protein